MDLHLLVATSDLEVGMVTTFPQSTNSQQWEHKTALKDLLLEDRFADMSLEGMSTP